MFAIARAASEAARNNGTWRRYSRFASELNDQIVKRSARRMSCGASWFVDVSIGRSITYSGGSETAIRARRVPAFRSQVTVRNAATKIKRSSAEQHTNTSPSFCCSESAVCRWCARAFNIVAIIFIASAFALSLSLSFAAWLRLAATVTLHQKCACYTRLNPFTSLRFYFALCCRLSVCANNFFRAELCALFRSPRAGDAVAAVIVIVHTHEERRRRRKRSSYSSCSIHLHIFFFPNSYTNKIVHGGHKIVAERSKEY